ncbi:MAG: carbonic anhydrase family protein [Deltaproteobacteria bacterium]|nr:carbonic anhydrase family protein [Deltaproteobacteria bacterium]MBW2394002.1 carbonic anhydrase family protein [Deltaproteobacteria bacterium]
MSVRWFAAIVLACVAPIMMLASDEQGPHWGYGRDDGPPHWASLDPDWATCATGRAQSPVDLARAEEVDIDAPARNYGPTSLEIAHHEHVVDVLDNGHTIQVDYDAGSTLTVSGRVYELQQYHFHAPSEHTVDGRAYPMEMHLVHRSTQGELVVMGVFIEEGAHNPAFEPVWSNFPTAAGEQRHLEHVEIDIDDLLPTQSRHFRYEGSLTTPPCSEGVRWFVLAEPVRLSDEQIRTFTDIFSHNNRPTQPTNGRTILLGDPLDADGSEPDGS